MKKILSVLSLILFSLVLPGSSFAADLKPPRFEIAPEISWITYKEPGVMKQTGTMSGFTGSYTYLEQIMLKLEAKVAYGQVDYESIETGSMDDIDDVLCEFRAIMGVDISFDPDYIIVPYAGYGYRFLEDDSQGRVTTNGYLGYTREANYYYAPIGLLVCTKAGDFIIGATIEYDHFWLGIQKSYLSRAVFGLNDIENKQKEGYGYRASLKIKKKQELFDILIEPYLRCWKIAQSESADISYSGIIIGFGYEPKNYSTEYGLKVALFF